MSSIAVVGAGAWGTALAIQAARAGHQVALVARPEAAAKIALLRENPRLPGVAVPDGMDIRDDLPASCGLVVWAVPVQHLRAAVAALGPAPGVMCAKGVEAGTNMLPLEVLRDAGATGPLAVLSGPNFAHEIARGLPAAAVVASSDAGLRAHVGAMLGSGTFRLYGNDDPVGAQIGGAAKNVIAIAAGAVTGAGLGENARAALVTRGLSELRRLTVASGGRAETVMGLSGLGDLLLTCTGASSRNFSLGYALATGRSLPETLAASAGVVEGVATAAALLARAGDIELPVCQAVADFLAGKQTLDSLMKQLLARPRRDE
jgi:glycerol-3-phosphate dehydrogenase (NAD(P)+)